MQQPVYTFTTRPARFCYGPHDRMVLHVVLKDGVEVMTGRHKPDLERWVEQQLAPPAWTPETARQRVGGTFGT
jgi:hypothetical protein